MSTHSKPGLDAATLASLVEVHRVHRRVYTDPEIFELEMTKVFAANWCYLAHESQIREPGDFVTTTIGRRPVVVTRDSQGAIHGLLNRCSHRGATLVSTASGCSKRFTCPYHGWTYRSDGTLVGMPYPANHPSQDRSEFTLGRLTVGSYRGFVFGTLNANPRPLEEWLGAARDCLDLVIDRHPGGQLTVLPSKQKLEYRGNWKLAWDNAADGIHATFAHHSYNELGSTNDIETVLARDPGSTGMVAKALGNGHMVVDQRPGIPKGPWATMRPMPFGEPLVAAIKADGNAAELDLATGSMVNLSLFPNLIFVGNQLLVVEPLEVDRTRLSLSLHLAPEAAAEINMLRYRVEEDFVSFGTPDDLEMFERVQEGLSIPEIEWVDVSRGLVDGVDQAGPDGIITGPITSEAPQRGYLAHYAHLLTADGITHAG
jgi:phenylpropionate dioxygenase-like ring-hydroxylating dioxygenase large terminal subunit